LTLLELGFRGSLACRLSILFRLIPEEQPRFEVPPAPVGHNVVVSNDLADWVTEESLSHELSVLNARETASWKFGLNFQNDKEKATIRYYLRLSSVRSSPFSFGSVREGWSSRLTPETVGERRRRLISWFSQPIEKKEKRLALFRILVDWTQSDSFEAPPSYSETVGGGLGSRSSEPSDPVKKE